LPELWLFANENRGLAPAGRSSGVGVLGGSRAAAVSTTTVAATCSGAAASAASAGSASATGLGESESVAESAIGGRCEDFSRINCASSALLAAAAAAATAAAAAAAAAADICSLCRLVNQAAAAAAAAAREKSYREKRFMLACAKRDQLRTSLHRLHRHGEHREQGKGHLADSHEREKR
jgi:hypothetical protein